MVLPRMVMKAPKHQVLIAGAGGVGRAAGLLLREIGEDPPHLFVGDIHPEQAREAAHWIQDRSAIPGKVQPFYLSQDEEESDFRRALEAADLLLDCLPGSEAPRMARLARKHDLHYANLTEHVAETEEVKRIAAGAETSFVLQTGLAPGFIDVLGHGLLRRFFNHHGIDRADHLALRTGGLTEHAAPPHFYGFTWSPIGVATEYLKPCRALRDGEPVDLPALGEIEPLTLDGVDYEEGLTSGGVADLPQALVGEVRDLEYKTVRYPGHYAWVKALIEEIGDVPDRPKALMERMLEVVPQVENDAVVVYASVQGRDGIGYLHRADVFRLVRPLEIGGRWLRAIQATTAAGLAECAHLLLEGKLAAGPVLQSEIDPETYLAGPFVRRVYQSHTLLDESNLARPGEWRPS